MTHGNQAYFKGNLTRGGTFCQCGAEKDRRAIRCSDCKAVTCFGNPDRVARRERSARYLSDYLGGMLMVEIAARDVISTQRVSALIQQGLTDSVVDLTEPGPVTPVGPKRATRSQEARR